MVVSRHYVDERFGHNLMRITPDIEDEIVALYKMDRGATAIAKLINCAPSTIWRFLRRYGVATRKRGVKGTKCRECGTATQGAKWCPKHIKLRRAEQGRERMRVTTKVKRPYYVEPFAEQSYRGPSAMRWHGRKSGRYGPIVMQAEQGLTKR